MSSSYILDMSIKGLVASISFHKKKVDIIDTATGQVVKQHDPEESRWCSGASVQNNIAALAMWQPGDLETLYGVIVMDLKSGKMLFKFTLPEGCDARVALSKDTLTLAVGTDKGMSWMYR
jgi:hypothetical protein